MDGIFNRNERLLGTEVLQLLKETTVMVVGLGGVGSFAAESVARLGVGHIILVDHDVIEPSNLNRQLYGLHSTIGTPKVEVARQRILDINPEAKVTIYQKFLTPQETEFIASLSPDFIIEAIDSLPSKCGLIQACITLGLPFISSTGMANRINPEKVSIQTLDQTSYDPVCRKLRLFARQNQIDLRKVRVVASQEPAREPRLQIEKIEGVRSPLASVMLVPATAGILCGKALLDSLLKL